MSHPEEGSEVRAASGRREEPYLLWMGGFISVVIVVVAFVIVANSQGGLAVEVSSSAFAAEQSLETSSAPANRATCAEIGSSDLRSPSEGLWFRSNCVPIPEPPLIAVRTECNQTSLNPAEFTSVAADLYVFRQTRGLPAYLWYSSSENCFDLVSARVVIAVCADQAVTFQSNPGSACASHGGVLVLVNER